MTELLTAAQMRAIEEAAIASGAVTGLELMERAGAGVVEAIFEEWPEMASARGASPPHPPELLHPKEGAWRAVVLCGPGNNGGDGFVVARLLRERGWEVEVCLYGDAAKLPPDARVNYERWCGMSKVEALSDVTLLSSLNAFFDSVWENEADLVVDAFFGTGLKRPLPHLIGDIFLDFVELRTNPSGRMFNVVAIDAPSGLCLDSGRIIGGEGEKREDGTWPNAADLTVTFHVAKIGHFLADGPKACGKVVIKGIGLDG